MADSDPLNTDPAALPAPLVPPEVDLRDFTFMPLDVVRLRDSDLVAETSPEACFAAVLLWCVAWHQVPAGSIPDSDQWQAKHAGYVARGKVDPAWMDVRVGALRNWVKCSDGRLYHPVVAEKALDAWAGKQAQRARTEKARMAKEALRQGQSQGLSQTDSTSVTEAATAAKGERQGERQGQGEGQGQMKEKTAAAAPPSPPAPPPAAEAAASRGKRLPADWELTKPWGEWAMAKYPHWTEAIVRDLGTGFGNHWKAKAGKDATKLDWFATWQNWCMSDITQRQYPPPKTATAPADADAARAARLAEARALIEARGRVPGFAPAAPINNPNVIDV